jgi:hypothetical protein
MGHAVVLVDASERAASAAGALLEQAARAA